MPSRGSNAPAVGAAAGLVLIALAAGVPAVTGWHVRSLGTPPINGQWAPRVGPGTIPALAIGALGARYAIGLAQRLAWRTLLVASFSAAFAWLVALALVDGTPGLGAVLDLGSEYLGTARHLDLPGALPLWVSRISVQDNGFEWPTHVAGHPPGATIFFWGLVHLGLGSALAAGLVITLIAATIPVAVLLTVRRLGAEAIARRVAPFIVLGPAAIWSAVSADAVFAATTAWSMCALAMACMASTPMRRAGWSTLAGLGFGAVVMESYGLLLVAILALAVLWIARDWRPLPIVGLAAAAVLGGFAASGFDYLSALSALRTRYWAGVASARPGAYWIWADLAALTLSAGPVAGAGIALTATRARRLLVGGGTRVAAGLTLAASSAVIAADASQMSRAEVERIWLPFVPWLLMGVALLPPRWRRLGLGVQVATALLVQHLVRTTW